MVSKGIEMGLVVVLVTMQWNGAAAQSGCTRVLMGLSPCLNYVTGNSSTPSSSCCSQLSNVVKSQPQCLCSLLNSGGGASLAVNINETLALALPDACNVQTPEVSQCNVASGPAASAATPASAPADSTPSDSSDETPETPTTPSESNNPSAGTGSKTVPSTDGTSSSGSTIKSPLQVALFLLFIVSCASTATVF